MAEVFLAMQEGIGGFEKLVVIKRIFRQFCEDENFVRMFLDEARLAASIRHQNVVQILDIQRDEEGFFIVMEYLSGESVAYLFEALRARGERLPPHIACRIAAEIAAGLHHAHTATDAAGSPQPIVHRDVTPSNLIVSFNGVVKVVDFGVAKATLGEGHTQAGALKGKMSYLAPEQVEDLPVDGRTDVFQLGICFHEMLTGQRLFTGESDHQKMLAVMEKPIPVPSTVAPDVPPEIDRVAMWALERNPDRRPQNADQFRRELEKVLKESSSTVSDHDLGEWMQTTLAQRHSDRRGMERECVAEMREGRSHRLESAPHQVILLGNGTQVGTHAGTQAGTRAGTPTLATVLHRKQTSASGTGGALTKRQGWMVAGVLATCMAAVGIGLWYLGSEEASAEAAAEMADLEPLPPLPDEPVAGKAPEADKVEEAQAPQEGTAPAEEKAPADGEPGGEQSAQARLEENKPPLPAAGDLPPSEGSEQVVVQHLDGANTYTISLRTEPVDAQVSLDDVPVPRDLAELPLRRGVKHRLVVTAEGYKPYRKVISEEDRPPEMIALKRKGKRRGPSIGPITSVVQPSAEPVKPKKKRSRPNTGNPDPWSD